MSRESDVRALLGWRRGVTASFKQQGDSDGESGNSHARTEETRDDQEAKQPSWVTIFVIWSSTMGTSLLAMPWAFQQAGIVQGVILQIFLAGLSVYTGILVLRVCARFADERTGVIPEFAIVCKILMGKFGIFITTASSVILFVGALIVFWILMSELLFNSVNAIRYYSTTASTDASNATEVNITRLNFLGLNTNGGGVDGPNFKRNDTSGLHDISTWTKNRTVPLILIVLMAPLMQLRSASFFNRFGAAGCIPVVLLVAYSIGKSATWGINVNFSNATSSHHVDTVLFHSVFNASFPALSGVLTMAFFLHNSMVTIFRGAKNPADNERNLMIAYLLVLATYAIVGISIYLSYPFSKGSIHQNFFEDIPVTDIFSVVTQFLLFLRFVTLFPLLAYILRVQIFLPITEDENPGHLSVGLLNLVVIAACVSCAMFYPHIGDIIRYSGAFCGMIFMYILPCGLEGYLQYREEQRLGLRNRYMRHLLHFSIAVFGVGNFCAQFSVTS